MQNPTFKDLISQPQLFKALENQGFEVPTEVQKLTIPQITAQQNLIVSAKTGSGKTAAFLLPAIQKILEQSPINNVSTRILILAPTRELARQITKSAQQFCRFTSLQVGMITGGDELKYQKALLRKNPEIVVGTPGRLAELVKLKGTDFSGLDVLILDEADRMLELGLSEDVLTIAGTCYAGRQTLLFSATMEQRGLRHLIKQVMQEKPAEEITVTEAANKIQQQIILADDVKHKEKLLLALLAKSTFTKAVIFANTKAKAAQLDGLLRYAKHTVSALHGDMTQDQRRRSLDIFRQDRTRLLVATDVAARGLDIDGVDLVVNFDMAHSGDDYIHRIGRTGRAESSGRAVSFITAPDWNLMSSIERYLKTSFDRIAIPGLAAAYEGPKKVKSSGKAAGAKKSPKAKKSAEGKPAQTTKVKVREKDKKNIGKRRTPSRTHEDGTSSATENFSADGFAPLKKKRSATPDLGDED